MVSHKVSVTYNSYFLNKKMKGSDEMKKQLSPWSQQCKVQKVVLQKSLKDISDETNISPNYISAVMNGRITASEEAIAAISQSLGVDPDLARRVPC